MIFKNRCSLCNGRLDGNKVCTECGLDNKKTERYYKINRSSCDGMPLTHVHEERKSSVKHRDEIRKKAPSGQVKEKNGKGCLVVILLFFFLAILGPMLFFVIKEVSYNMSSGYGYNPYEYLEEELPQEGETVSYELTSGEYVAGVHIPAGYYQADVEDDFDSVEVTDYEHGINLYEFADDEDNYLHDIRLFPGARLIIRSETKITMTSENAQVADMKGMVNLSEEEYYLEAEEEAIAGESIEPGVYDIYTSGESGSVIVTIYDEAGNEWETREFLMGTDGYDGVAFMNLVLPENAVISCTEDLELWLTPSAVISSTNYLDYYM